MRAAVVIVLAAVLVVQAPYAALAASHDDAVEITMPVDGSFSNDYAAGRAGGRIHRATDVFADMGTPVHAAMGGVVTWAPHDEHVTAGFALQIEGDDGRTYAYYHLGEAGGSRSEALPAGIEEGARVERGQRIGYLGNSGNAVHTPPHLHFEIHDPGVTDPYGTSRINPYASLQAALERGDLPETDKSDRREVGRSPAPAPAPPTDDEDRAARYIVRDGDTLSEIARDHGIDEWETLLAWNETLDDPHLIFPGDELRVLPPVVRYRVREGDTLTEIARDHSLDDWEVLLEQNPHVEEPDLIYPGEVIAIPLDDPAAT